LVLEIKKLGLHYVEKGIRVINLIISQMNLNRLSTNPAKLSQCLAAKLKEDISELLSVASNLEVKNGKTLIKSLNKYYTGRGNKVYILDKNGLLLYSFDSISKCAKFLGISGGTVSKRLVDNKPVIVGSKEFFISKPPTGASVLFIKSLAKFFIKNMPEGVVEIYRVILSKQKVNPGPKLVYMKSTSYTEIFVGLDQFLPLWPVASIPFFYLIIQNKKRVRNYRPLPYLVCLCSSVSYYSNTSNNILRIFTKTSPCARIAPRWVAALEGRTIKTKSLSHVTSRWDIKLFSTYRQTVNSQNVNSKSKLAFILPNFDGAKRIGPHN